MLISQACDICDRSEPLITKRTDRFKEWDRKYTWKAEIKSSDKIEADRKYQYTAEIKGLEGRKYEWTAEIESPERNATDRKYEWTTEIKGRKQGNVAKNHDTCKAFGSRSGAVARLRGKRKVLSPDEAALVIERTFRVYLIRRSKALRSLRELAVEKAKLKEIRALFNNYSYRQSIARDSEERQRFSERIISLILTVDAIQGADLMVRAARRSMLDELEAMLDAIDPHPSGKLGFLKRQEV
ncbi:hypothetical protein CRYUN_Cryun01aG0244300 [Craigia yunnanensis]